MARGPGSAGRRLTLGQATGGRPRPVSRPQPARGGAGAPPRPPTAKPLGLGLGLGARQRGAFQQAVQGGTGGQFLGAHPGIQQRIATRVPAGSARQTRVQNFLGTGQSQRPNMPRPPTRGVPMARRPQATQTLAQHPAFGNLMQQVNPGMQSVLASRFGQAAQQSGRGPMPLGNISDYGGGGYQPMGSGGYTGGGYSGDSASQQATLAAQARPLSMGGSGGNMAWNNPQDPSSGYLPQYGGSPQPAAFGGGAGMQTTFSGGNMYGGGGQQQLQGLQGNSGGAYTPTGYQPPQQWGSAGGGYPQQSNGSTLVGYGGMQSMGGMNRGMAGGSMGGYGGGQQPNAPSLAGGLQGFGGGAPMGGITRAPSQTTQNQYGGGLQGLLGQRAMGPSPFGSTVDPSQMSFNQSRGQLGSLMPGGMGANQRM
jgi:hypothetical protein